MVNKIAAFSISLLFLPMIAQAQTGYELLSSGFGTGTVSGQIGMDFRVNDFGDDNNDGNIGLAYLEVDYLSNDFKGLRVGAGAVGVLELWARKSFEFAFDDGGIFDDKFMWRDLYLQYSIPFTESELLVGRKQFEGSPVTDGDLHQGVQLTISDIANTTIYASLINRWVDNASTAYDMDGINNTWIDGDGVVQGASDAFYSFIAEFIPLPDVMTITPFINHQNKVVTSLGSSVEFYIPINDQIKAGFDGVVVEYDEDTDATSDEDAYSYLAHGSLSSEVWQIGLGYYVMSNDARVASIALGNDTFDPMEEGPYGGSRDDNTVFLDASYSYGPMSISAVLGDTEVDFSSEGATEFDLYLEYVFSDNLNAELMFVDVNDDDSTLDYQVFAGSINLTF